METRKKLGPKPEWLKVRLGSGEEYKRVRSLLKRQKLHTVCEEALCPNMGRCWEKGRATVMILGDTCSRSCRFCGVASRRPCEPDMKEPERVASAVAEMGLSDIVITSVTRDDLPDGGSAIWAETIRRVYAAVPGISIEVLIPDFRGDESAIMAVIDEHPTVLAHNLETVPRLYSTVRPQAEYECSLRVLEFAKEKGMITKSGIMVGIGESNDEIKSLMEDTVKTGCNIFTIGQYLQPSKEHLPVERYVTPAEFDLYKKWGEEMGFDVVISAPLVRSSYHSDEQEEFVKNVLSS